MPIHLQITDANGFRELTLDHESFWIGSVGSRCEVELQVPGHGRLVEVRHDARGLQVRAAPGLPFPVRNATGSVGTRFDTLIEGDVLNIGPAMVKLHASPLADAGTGEDLDPALLVDDGPIGPRKATLGSHPATIAGGLGPAGGPADAGVEDAVSGGGTLACRGPSDAGRSAVAGPGATAGASGAAGSAPSSSEPRSPSAPGAGPLASPLSDAVAGRTAGPGAGPTAGPLAAGSSAAGPTAAGPTLPPAGGTGPRIAAVPPTVATPRSASGDAMPVAHGAPIASVAHAASGSHAAPGAPVGAWYQTFMELADTLEGIAAGDRMLRAAMEAILSSTGADRVCLEIDPPDGGAPVLHHLAHGGDRAPFRVSRSLIERVRDTGRVVHVPVAQADPVASRFTSVRREGISSTIALPLRALGKTLGVLYADCVREGAVLTAGDLQRVAFIGRLLASALGNRALVADLVRVEPTGVAAHPALQTASPACAEMVAAVKLYAPTDYTVLIRGETGSGKEVIAGALHELSRRRKGPFVPVNCAAIPEQLMESMLFGHEKGAFTGATQARRGHFEEAHGGTIFLDEIGDMAADLQAKILRVLQDRVVMPVGSRRAVKVDVRILAATHQDLERMVHEGRFREDLYYRLRELEIHLPPLRERLEDLPLLSHRFLAEAASELGYDAVPELAAETLAWMRAQPWRGNIRELRHAIKGAALRSRGRPIQVRHLDAVPSLRREPALGPGSEATADPRAVPGGPAMADGAPGAQWERGAADLPPGRGTHGFPGGPASTGTGSSTGTSTSTGIGSGSAEDGTVGREAVAEPRTWKERLEAQELEALRTTLEQASGNLTKGAELFGVPRTTYREKLVKHGLLRERS